MRNISQTGSYGSFWIYPTTTFFHMADDKVSLPLLDYDLVWIWIHLRFILKNSNEQFSAQTATWRQHTLAEMSWQPWLGFTPCAIPYTLSVLGYLSYPKFCAGCALGKRDICACSLSSNLSFVELSPLEFVYPVWWRLDAATIVCGCIRYFVDYSKDLKNIACFQEN